MIDCSFKLNGQPLSALVMGAVSVPAFSGRAPHINSVIAACLVGVGPIPPGMYYIFDRQGGGRLEMFKNLFNDHGEWFALYAVDGQIDDHTYCNRVRRGQFRLHPKGPRGISEGCITIEKEIDFRHIRAILKSKAPTDVPGSQLKAYGRVVVQ
jgi:Protein of unknown function (DUF2778)